MHLGVECLRNMVFDWCSGLSINIKKQIIDCKLGKKKNFDYPSIILTAFFFERVPALSPKVTLSHPHSCELRLTTWRDVLVRQGGGDIRDGYDDEFYSWWIRQVPAFEQFPYAGLEFQGDIELMLPLGDAWGEMGNSFAFHIFDFYEYFVNKCIYICTFSSLSKKCI